MTLESYWLLSPRNFCPYKERRWLGKLKFRVVKFDQSEAENYTGGQNVPGSRPPHFYLGSAAEVP